MVLPFSCHDPVHIASRLQTIFTNDTRNAFSLFSFLNFPRSPFLLLFSLPLSLSFSFVLFIFAFSVSLCHKSSPRLVLPCEENIRKQYPTLLLYTSKMCHWLAICKFSAEKVLMENFKKLKKTAYFSFVVTPY